MIPIPHPAFLAGGGLFLNPNGQSPVVDPRALLRVHQGLDREFAASPSARTNRQRQSPADGRSGHPEQCPAPSRECPGRSVGS